MKIIQPSHSFERSKASTSSGSESSTESNEHQVVYKQVDAESLSRTDRPNLKRKERPKARRKLWKSRSKNKVDGGLKQESQNEEELDFDTAKLEAMPNEHVAEPLIEGKKRRRSELVPEKASESLELIVDPAKEEFNELFARGVRLLAMREHSVKEITDKLFDKSENASIIHAVVDGLLQKRYLSDERFTESYVRSRSNRGFGPVKIKAELKSKGVINTLIQDYLDEGAPIWFDNAQSQYQKKYGDAPISDYNAWTKRARFMQSRGFTMEHIHVTVPRVEFD